LSDEEIESMVDEAKAHADEDKAAKDKIETKNKADSMIYQTEKQLKEHGENMTDDIKQPVEDGIATLKKQLEEDDTEGMKATMTEVEQHLMKFGEKIYEQQQQAGGAQGAPEGQSCDPNCEQECSQDADKKDDDDNIVDAEVIDDDK
jgi:molecular chaperone DnaK